jgi:hypothetical protein
MRQLSILSLSTTLVTTACELKPVSGADEVLSFRYDADEQLVPLALSAPVAIGLFSRVEVYGVEGLDAPANVVDASSGAPEVIEVVATTGNTLTLEAKTPGSAEITVVTALGEDRFEVSADTLGKVDLKHPGLLVSDNPPSKAVVGGTVRFFASLATSSQKALVGFGALPIEVAPMGSATIEANEELGSALIRFGTEGTVTLTGEGDEPLAVDVVTTTAIVDLTFGLGTEFTLREGEVGMLKLRGVTGDGSSVVGVASLAAVTTSTPGLCDVSPNPKLGEGVYKVSSKAVGDCLVSGTLGSLSTTAKFTIIPQ